MSLIRAFIAIEIPPATQNAIWNAIAQFRNGLGDCIRWVLQNHIHLTLKFLGEIPTAEAISLGRVLRAETDSFRAFEISIRGLGSYPSLNRPRLLWARIQAPAELEALARQIEFSCVRLGYPSEPRPFSPHLTLGRIRQDTSRAAGQRIRQCLEVLTIDLLGMARVDSVHLFSSKLKPSGAVYTKLYSAPFQHSIEVKSERT